MSDYHILQQSARGDRIQVAFHIPIPDANNTVGVNWRTIIPQTEVTESAVPFIEAAEQTQLDNGELIERVVTVDVLGADSPASKLAVIVAYWTEHKPKLLETLQRKLQYYGKSDDVA